MSRKSNNCHQIDFIVWIIVTILAPSQIYVPSTTSVYTIVAVNDKIKLKSFMHLSKNLSLNHIKLLLSNTTNWALYIHKQTHDTNKQNKLTKKCNIYFLVNGFLIETNLYNSNKLKWDKRLKWEKRTKK